MRVFVYLATAIRLESNQKSKHTGSLSRSQTRVKTEMKGEREVMLLEVLTLQSQQLSVSIVSSIYLLAQTHVLADNRESVTSVHKRKYDYNWEQIFTACIIRCQSTGPIWKTNVSKCPIC